MNLISPVRTSWNRVDRRATPIWLCLGATWLIWGSTYLAIRFALVSLPPFFQMGSRFIVAGVVLMAWMRWRAASWPTRIQWRNAAVVGSLMLASGMGSLAYAETSVASGLVVAFLAATPLVIAALNLLWGVRPRTMEVLGIVVGLAGVVMLTQGSGFRASSAGLLAMIVACTGWSLGSVLSQRALPLAPGGMGFASEMICGGILLLVASVFHGESIAWPLQPMALSAWIYLVIFGSLIGFSAYMVLLSRTSAAVASSYTLVNPVIAMLLGVWLGHEQVTPFEWLSALVIMAGVLLLWKRKAKAPLGDSQEQ